MANLLQMFYFTRNHDLSNFIYKLSPFFRLYTSQIFVTIFGPRKQVPKATLVVIVVVVVVISSLRVQKSLRLS